MLNWRNWTWKHLFVALLVLHLIPIWIFAYFPSQDGPSHVYNGLVLKEYAKPANYKLRDAWELNITVFPNWLSHIALMLLLYVFPPVIAEKVFLTIAIGMIPIAFFYFLHAVHGKPKEEEGEAGGSWHTFAWLGFPFAYNYLLYMGFYNFTLSIAFFFFSFGFWWKHKDDMQVQHLVWLYVLLLLTYLSHIASYGLVVLGMSIVAGCLWGGNALATTWRERNARWTHQLWQCLKPLIRFGLYMVPMYFVLLDYYLFSIKEHPTGNHRGMEWVWDYFVGIKSIVYFHRLARSCQPRFAYRVRGSHRYRYRLPHPPRRVGKANRCVPADCYSVHRDVHQGTVELRTGGLDQRPDSSLHSADAGPVVYHKHGQSSFATPSRRV